jgi:hypothetical protein
LCRWLSGSQSQSGHKRFEEKSLASAGDRTSITFIYPKCVAACKRNAVPAVSPVKETYGNPQLPMINWDGHVHSGPAHNVSYCTTMMPGETTASFKPIKYIKLIHLVEQGNPFLRGLVQDAQRTLTATEKPEPNLRLHRAQHTFLNCIIGTFLGFYAFFCQSEPTMFCVCPFVGIFRILNY